MSGYLWTGTGTPPDPVDGMPADDMRLQRMIEATTDVLMDECKDSNVAMRLAVTHGLDDDPALLAKLMSIIAAWDGSTASAGTQIRLLHNVMADAMQKIAIKESEKWKR